MMTPEDWENIRFFSPEEAWGDPYKMDHNLIIRLDQLRELAGKPIIIHCGYATEGHSLNSFHYKGMAADLHIEGYSLLDQYLLAEQAGPFGGIGVYPDWSRPGLHLDVRPGPHKRWGRTDGIYTPLRGYSFEVEER